MGPYAATKFINFNANSNIYVFGKAKYDVEVRRMTTLLT
jgi:hypothetical protein